jgi:putative transposase
MAKWKKLAHAVYQCSYHPVWIPKAEFVEKKQINMCMKEGRNIRVSSYGRSCSRSGSHPAEDNNLRIDGDTKKKDGKIAALEKLKSLRTKPYWGNHFWSYCYYVTAVGMDEAEDWEYTEFIISRGKISSHL